MTWEEDLERRARAAAVRDRGMSQAVPRAAVQPCPVCRARTTCNPPTRDCAYTLANRVTPVTPIEQPRTWEFRRRQMLRDRCLNIGCWLLGACCLAGFVWIVAQ